ncbi:hypothetical protein AAKU55_005789 [Oxalobacteraceae bacterium GrIS 1.11]
MNDTFDLLREAITQCREELGASHIDELLAFRNAANLYTIEKLLKQHDRMSETLAAAAAVHSVGMQNAGVLNLEELKLIDAYRSLDARGKFSLEDFASALVDMTTEHVVLPRCEVVDISNKRTT